MEEFWDEMMPGRYPPPMDIVFTEEKKLEREEVMAEMQPLLQRLRDNWTEELDRDIQDAEADATSVISKERFMVYGGQYWSSTLVMSSFMRDLERGVEMMPLTPEQKAFFEKGLTMLNEFIDCVEWHNKRDIQLPVLDPKTFEALKSSKDIQCNLPNFLRKSGLE
ncbi:hypothetical protein V8C34DRAFT_300937 [Trichoderma compactum]